MMHPGMIESHEHAERVEPGWTALALGELRAFVRQAVGPFTIEQARAWIGANTRLPAPPDLRAWGMVTARAQREGVIERTGDYAAARSSHGAPKPLYRGCEGVRS